MDVLTPEQRRKNMQAIKAKDTKIEIMLRQKLWEKGYRYRKNYKNLPGKPDIVFLKLKIAIFCDSEFWHGYNWEDKKKRLGTNREFWIKKIENNMERDKKVNEKLILNGWIVLRFWETEIKKNLDDCIRIIEEIIQQRKTINKPLSQ
ncbi:very short patch repair endonuclease [Thermoanaerobacterium thermosaccharolyticum]|uniref:very short patch repair endonuclease n=1 Tax=Thermoanaerobacterium thermosaccharolyticum TaxID=1517 RepID=UPI001784F794|nr:very short patch repair endonuclease [Thermoanaerobacterium thermosaccharolyticum]MBE0069214.1 very short patch repair endonuclease [Thermoanaerobacterium thermosaccharolyticum]MBE0228114.1 very short patch repair endonuclease [Thermoanaerobacterium thermosaccharolyticum]